MEEKGGRRWKCDERMDGVEGMRWKWMKMSENGRELKNPRLGGLFSAYGCLERGLGLLESLYRVKKP